MYYSKSTGGFYDSAIHGDNIPADAVDITSEYHMELFNGQSQGKIISADENGRPVLIDQPPPSAEQVVAQYTAAIQARLDGFARTRGYDGILSACTYATSAVEKFAAEGQYCVDARDSTWSACYTILGAVESGSRPMPTLDDIIAEMPVLEWPA